MANLAIKGHATRGKEVIELLEMLGGRNPIMRDGTNTDFYYSIDKRGVIQWECNDHIHYFGVTLEGFLEKFPYKVGDKVVTREGEHCKITSMQWNDEREEVLYGLSGHDVLFFSATFLQPYAEQKEESMEEKSNNWAKWDLPEGYEFQDGNGNVINATKIMLVKKQPQYPKTYEECCDISRIPNDERYVDIDVPLHYHSLLKSFTRLLICRDAYWKIAGDWKDARTKKTMHYIIYSTLLGEVVKDCQPNGIANFLLDFPTSEIRDAFYENFKELIEECKELL